MSLAQDHRPIESPAARISASSRRCAARRGAPGSTRRAEDAAAACSSANPFASTIFPADGSRRQAAGGASHWHAALDWLEEQDGPTALVESPPIVDDSAEAVLAELGLTENLTERELSRLRRLYMWRNHPDRHRESQRAKRDAAGGDRQHAAGSRPITIELRPPAVGATGGAPNGRAIALFAAEAAAWQPPPVDWRGIARWFALPTAPRLGNVVGEHCVGWGIRADSNVFFRLPPESNGPP